MEAASPLVVDPEWPASKSTLIQICDQLALNKEKIGQPDDFPGKSVWVQFHFLLDLFGAKGFDPSKVNAILKSQYPGS